MRTNSLYCSSPTECGANGISGSFASCHKNKPSDVVSATWSVFFQMHLCYIRVPSALHPSNPCGMIYAFSTFCKQVLTDIWRSAPVTVGGPRKPVCKRWRQTSQCSQRHGNNRGQSTLDNRNAEDSN